MLYYAFKFLGLTDTFKVYIVCQFESVLVKSRIIQNNTGIFWKKCLGDAVVCVYFQEELLPFKFHGEDSGAISFTVSIVIHLKTYIWT